MAADGLQIDEEIEFQQRMWSWQRRAWGAIAAVLAFAALGGFGDGPLSSTEAFDATRSLRVSYERFGRLDSPTTVEVRVEPGADGRLGLRLGSHFLEDFAVEGLESYSAAAVFDGEGVTFSIPARPGVGEVVVALEVRPRSPGPARIEIGLEGGQMLSLRQFVYP
ncbi:hypothetical protein [Planctomyces sp. SH-PL62]|uniref:hypothetical protein n=1 Tax=Planctomyces sp. SH-PL62 TaxID=1636152 RepID=UPI00078C5D28|nr:hypothetical protein [Planctomyces sp. SH-PL62]AMV37337.1 hypothetical protein VT85_07880 [Planctomyces sp. SH-PL62]